MKNLMKSGMSVLLVCGLAAFAMAQETLYKSGTASSAVTFGPQLGKLVVKSVYGTTDKDGAVVKFYARGGAGKAAPTASPTNAALIIEVANTGLAFTTNDCVVYAHANGTMDYTTVSEATTTNVTLAAGITVAGAAGDFLYEVTQQGQVGFTTTGAGVGTNVFLAIEGDIFVTPGDSPLYAVIDGTSNTVLQVTVGN